MIRGVAVPWRQVIFRVLARKEARRRVEYFGAFSW